jgi:hypothetical protein
LQIRIIEKNYQNFYYNTHQSREELTICVLMIIMFKLI